ncbi:MAG: hypothetical protein RIB30_21245 [Thalassospira sp.]|uniref:hypothetical protein n=1 Tax=Thalassospira sp. TaxID=1912094 RepID=UPI0032F06847
MKHSTLRKYVHFYALKPVKYLGISLFAWPVIAGYLDYNDVLSSTDWMNCSVAIAVSVLIFCSPRRRLSMRYFVYKATISGWKRRSNPKLSLFVGHWVWALFLMIYAEFAENPEATFLLPAATFGLIGCASLPLLLWRPLILRVLFGFDKRTKVFGFLV